MKTVFVPGSIVTSEFLNLVNNPFFSDTASDGSIPKITWSDLSDAPGEIVADWAAFRGAFEVSINAGLTVTVAAGVLSLPTLAPVAYPEVNYLLPDDTISYLYFDVTGTLSDNTVRPSIGYVIAKVTTSSGSVTNIEDYRPIAITATRPELTRCFGGQGSEGVVILSNPTDLTGDHYFESLVIDPGVTVTAEGYCHIRVAGSVTISGQIIVNPRTPGGAGYLGAIACPGTLPSSTGAGLGGGTQFTGSAASPYGYWNGAGSGGASGAVRGSLQNPGATYPADSGFSNSISVQPGGNGGGVLIIEAGGPVHLNNCILSANGESANDAPQPTTSLQQYIIISGAGGGSGGLISVSSAESILVEDGSALQVSGGAGGEGNITANRINDFVAEGGGGGSGGYIVFHAPSVTQGLATYAIDGGAAGADVGGSINQFASIEGGGGASFAGIGGVSQSAGASGSVLTFAYLTL